MKPMIVYTKFLKIKTKTKLSQLRIIQRKKMHSEFLCNKVYTGNSKPPEKIKYWHTIPKDTLFMISFANVLLIMADL